MRRISPTGGRSDALVRARRRRRLLRAGARQPGPAPADRRALPRTCSASRPSWSTAASCPARRCRCWSATSSTPGRRCSWRAPTGRTDVCALPYGINTVSLFAYVFLVMLPAKLAAEAAGAADPARVAWQAGLVACVGSGLIELGGALRRRADPQGDAARRAALDARRHRPHLHLARLPLPHLRAAARRPDRRSRSCMLVYFGRVRVQAAACPAGWSRSPSAPCSPGSRASRRWAPRRDGGSRFYPPMPVLGDLVAALAGELADLPLGDPADGPVQRHRLAAEHRVGRGRGRLATRPGRRSPSTASARSPRRSSAPASRPRSTSAIRAGRRWARAPATRC